MTKFVLTELSAAQSHFEMSQSLSSSVTFPPFMEVTRRFINVVTRACDWSLFPSIFFSVA